MLQVIGIPLIVSLYVPVKEMGAENAAYGITVEQNSAKNN